MDSVGTTALHQVETGLQAYDVEVRGDMPTLLFHRLYLRVLIRDDDQLFPGCRLMVWVPCSPVQGPQPCDRWAMLEKDPGSRNFEGLNPKWTVSPAAACCYKGLWVSSKTVLGDITPVSVFCGHHVWDNFGLVKRLIQVFYNIHGKSPSKLFGQPNTFIPK